MSGRIVMRFERFLLTLAAALCAACADEPPESGGTYQNLDGTMVLMLLTDTDAELTIEGFTSPCTYSFADGELRLTSSVEGREAFTNFRRKDGGYFDPVTGLMLYAADELAERRRIDTVNRSLIQAATRRLLEACLAKDREAIFKHIHPMGWVIRQLDVSDRLRYRFWRDMPTPEEVEEARAFRIEQDEQIYGELVALPGLLALADSATIRDAVRQAETRIAGKEAWMDLANDGIQVVLILGLSVDSEWVVQDWRVSR